MRKWRPLEWARGEGGYSIYPWVGRCVAAPHTLTLFKTNIADFPTLFTTEFRFLIPCLSQRKSILINIRACKNFAVYRPRKDILFKTTIDKSIPWLRQKMIKSIPCLRQNSRKTYPGWPHVPIKPLWGSTPRENGTVFVNFNTMRSNLPLTFTEYRIWICYRSKLNTG